jgi:hypothetical protein
LRLKHLLNTFGFLVGLSTLLAVHPAPASAVPYLECFSFTESSQNSTYLLTVAGAVSCGANVLHGCFFWNCPANPCTWTRPAGSTCPGFCISGATLTGHLGGFCLSPGTVLTVQTGGGTGPFYCFTSSSKLCHGSCGGACNCFLAHGSVCCGGKTNIVADLGTVPTVPLGAQGMTFDRAVSATALVQTSGTFDFHPAAAPEVDADSAAIPLALVAGGLALALNRRRQV